MELQCLMTSAALVRCHSAAYIFPPFSISACAEGSCMSCKQYFNFPSYIQYNPFVTENIVNHMAESTKNLTVYLKELIFDQASSSRFGKQPREKEPGQVSINSSSICHTNELTTGENWGTICPESSTS